MIGDLRPLVRKNENVYLDLAQVYNGRPAGKLHQMVRIVTAVFGKRLFRLLFGASMLQVLRANISDKDKENIPNVNMERIVGGIRYD